MGIIVQEIMGDGPVMKTNVAELNLSADWVWVVIRRDPAKTPADWHIQGVASDEEIAKQMCLDDSYIIGPIPFNIALPHDRVEWPGSYFPLRKK